MGCRILTNAKGDAAVMFCSTSMWAFGPVFEEREGLEATEVAERFLKWMGYPSRSRAPLDPCDPRTLDDVVLERKYHEFLGELPALIAADEADRAADENARAIDEAYERSQDQPRRTGEATARALRANPLPTGARP